VFLLAQDLEQTLTLYKSLKALGDSRRDYERDIKVDREAMWATVAAAVESVGDMRIYAFRAEVIHYYFAVKTGQVWKAAVGKLSRRLVNTRPSCPRSRPRHKRRLMRHMQERGVKVRQKDGGMPYIRLTDEDLELFGVK